MVTDIRRLSRETARLLFANRCILCGAAAGERRFCVPCRRDLPRIRFACPKCGQPVPSPLPPGLGCADCLDRPAPFRSARAALLYAFPVDAALKAFKFNGRLSYGPAFAELMISELETHFQHVDALLPVPLHRWRHATRGFNQALELARPLARSSGLPIVTRTCRVRRTRPQTGLSAAARRRNMRQAFAMTGAPGCRHPLIVDDVMTTGETCRQLAGVLLAAGAEDVSVLTAARAAHPS